MCALHWPFVGCVGSLTCRERPDLTITYLTNNGVVWCYIYQVLTESVLDGWMDWTHTCHSHLTHAPPHLAIHPSPVSFFLQPTNNAHLPACPGFCTHCLPVVSHHLPYAVAPAYLPADLSVYGHIELASETRAHPLLCRWLAHSLSGGLPTCLSVCLSAPLVCVWSVWVSVGLSS